MTAKTLRISFLLLLPTPMWAQSATLEGRILDAKTRAPLIGAYVQLLNPTDSTERVLTPTDDNGEFKFSNLSFRSYRLDVMYLGYTKFSKVIEVDKASMHIGDILMSESAISMGEIVVKGIVPPAVQKADTTEFNARAFKTNPDADAADLLAKMPGITVDNGSVKAQGEDVQQVLVDGKPFFGNDPTLALRNLPAEVIEKIQVFDKMSDQAEFTGFDDGQSVKTVNIVTRADRRNTQFGKTYGGYGDDERYLTGGNLNLFSNDTRLSVIGLSNNINQQNFSSQDLLGIAGNTNQGRGGGGGGGRRGGGGFGGSPGGGNGASNFLVGQQNGISSTSSLGVNYTDKWATGLNITQSYFFNHTNNTNSQNLQRQYIASRDSNTLYEERTNADARNSNHRIDTRLEYTADSSNSIIVRPQFYFQNNHSSNNLAGMNTLPDGMVLNQTANGNQTTTSGNNLSGHVTLRHKFGIPGRTISVDLGATSNRKKGSGTLQSLSQFYGQTPENDTTDQQSVLSTRSTSFTSRLVYTEPAGSNGLVQLNYNPSYSKGNSDNRKYSYNPVTQKFSELEPSLSNTYQNTYVTQNVGAGYRLRGDGFNVMAGASYQIATLKGDQQFPLSNTVRRTFYNILPNAMLNINGADHTNMRIFYRTSTKPPDINQLQSVIDNSNPLLLTRGNPDLKQSFSHTIATRYSHTGVDKGESFFLLLSAGYTKDYVGNSVQTAARDTTLAGGIRLSPGTQLTYPVNLDGNWNIRSFLTYGLPVHFIGSSLNFNGGYTYARTPGMINQSLNVSHTSVVTGGVVVASNISENVDFTLSYTGNYNISHNSLQPDLNSNYFNHTAGLRVNFTFWEGVVFRSDVKNMLYSGLGDAFDQSYVLWNASIGKKLFANDRGELTLSVADLLDQNKSVTRTVTDTYLEDVQTQVLPRYFMLSFTYTFR